MPKSKDSKEDKKLAKLIDEVKTLSNTVNNLQKEIDNLKSGKKKDKKLKKVSQTSSEQSNTAKNEAKSSSRLFFHKDKRTKEESTGRKKNIPSDQSLKKVKANDKAKGRDKSVQIKNTEEKADQPKIIKTICYVKSCSSQTKKKKKSLFNIFRKKKKNKSTIKSNCLYECCATAKPGKCAKKCPFLNVNTQNKSSKAGCSNNQESPSTCHCCAKNKQTKKSKKIKSRDCSPDKIDNNEIKVTNFEIDCIVKNKNEKKSCKNQEIMVNFDDN